MKLTLKNRNIESRFSLLKIEAKVSCEYRGHIMSKWEPGEWYRDTIRHSECQECKMQVTINTKPQPNEIDISGEAIALDCPVML